MKQRLRIFEQAIPPDHLKEGFLPPGATVVGIYLTDMWNTHCCDLSPSWFHAALEYRVNGVEDEEQRQALEDDLNMCAGDDRGYMYVRDAERIPALAEREIEIEDEELAGFDNCRIQAAFLQAAREDFQANPWA